MQATALLVLILTLPLPTHSDVTLHTVFLINLNAFPTNTYEAMLSSHFTTNNAPVSLLYTRADTITGAEARQRYFPGHTEIPLFQVVHLTRVGVSVPSNNDANTTDYLTRYLPSLCQTANLGPAAIVASDPINGPDLLQQLPPLLAPALAAILVLSLLSCGACWLCVYCCKRKPAVLATHGQLPGQPAVAVSQPIPPQATMLPRPTAPPIHLMRLPSSMEAQCADLYDPYESRTHYAGPAAVRLASWPVEPAGSRP
jgi:hypothetical protein